MALKLQAHQFPFPSFPSPGLGTSSKRSAPEQHHRGATEKLHPAGETVGIGGDDNPYSEALFRTVKYRRDYPYRGFESLEEARRWVLEFVRWYNHDHQHSAIRFVTPCQRHNGEDHDILAARRRVYEEAKARHPERWSGNIRNWEPVAEVWLNPPADANRQRTSVRAA
jgi:hypothetical protein